MSALPPSQSYGVRSPDGRYWWDGQAWQPVPWDPSLATPPGYPLARETNGLAVAALVCSIAGLFTGFTAVLGIVLGFIARSQIKASAGHQTGEGLALAAIIIGIILLALGILVIIALVALVQTVPFHQGAFPTFPPFPSLRPFPSFPTSG